MESDNVKLHELEDIIDSSCNVGNQSIKFFIFRLFDLIFGEPVARKTEAGNAVSLAAALSCDATCAKNLDSEQTCDVENLVDEANPSLEIGLDPGPAPYPI